MAEELKMATKSGLILTVVAGIVVTAAVALGGWNLSKTAAIPETYATKVEIKEVQRDAEKDRDRIREDV